MIEIDTNLLNEYGKDFENLSYSYFAIINKIFNRISGMPTSTGEWVGESAQRFARNASVDKKQYTDFYRVARQYSTYLINASTKVDNLCKRIKKR